MMGSEKMVDCEMKRNGSGYYDETAYKAYMVMVREGGIWTENDGKEEVLILKNQGRYYNCLKVYPENKSDDCIRIVGTEEMFIIPGMVMYRYRNRLGRFVQKLPSGEFEKVQKAVDEALNVWNGDRDKETPCREECHALLDKILDKVGVV